MIGNLDRVDMDDNRRAAATTKITTFLTACKALWPSSVVWKHVYWYDTPDDGSNAGQRISDSVINVGGTAAGGPLPPQVACSMTWRTDQRKNWGRIYLPSIQQGAIDSQGSLQQTWMDTIANAGAAMSSRGGTNTETVCVWSTTELTHHDPQQVVVDDVLDVIRSRRYSSTLRRTIKTI